MSATLNELSSYMAGSPLTGLTLTLLAYQAGLWCFRRSGGLPWANPVLIAIALICIVLWLSGMPYAEYFAGVQMIHFLLGPSTVALAVPLFTKWKNLKRMALPLTVGLFVGCIAAAFSAMAIARWLGASTETVRSLAPKSATTPIAMGVAEKIGGLSSLTAIFVILTGITGAVCFPALFRLFKFRNHAAQGFAVGLAAHGLGTAHAFMVSEKMGAFAALGMGMNGMLTALLLPLLI